MSVNRRFFIGFFNYGIGQFLPKLINFLLIPLYAFYLSPTELGVYDIFYTLFSFMLILMRFNLPGAITRFYFDYQGKEELKNYIKTIYLTVFLVSFFVLVITFIFDGWILRALGVDSNSYSYFVIIMICAFLAGNGDIQKRLLQVREESAYSAKLNVATTVLNIFFSVLFVVILDQGIRGLFYTMLISSVIFFIQSQFYLRDFLKSKTSFKLLPSSLKYSAGILPYLIIGHLSPVILKSLLNNMFSPAAVGVFSMASRLTSPQLLVISAFSSAVTPIYFSFLKEGSNVNFSDYQKSINRFLLFAFVAMIIFTVIMPPAIELFLPQRYNGSAGLVSIISLGFMPQILYILVSQDIFYSKKTMVVSIVNVIGMLISLLVSYLLIPKFQEVGLAIGQLITPVFGMIFTFLFSKSKTKNYHMTYIVIVIYTSLLLILYNYLTLDFDSIVRLILGTGLIPIFIFFHPRFKVEAIEIFKTIFVRIKG
jgi:O-antigen/teichoic acid export membrane protein